MTNKITESVVELIEKRGYHCIYRADISIIRKKLKDDKDERL